MNLRAGGSSGGGNLMADTRRLIPIPADWVLKRIQEGKSIRLKNAQINGNIDLSKLDPPKKSSTKCRIISSNIRIDHSEFRDALTFFDCFFNANVGFINVIFNKDAMFVNSTFSGESSFNNTTFNEHAGFYNATFNKGVRFDNATFNTIAGFSSATFCGIAAFYNATFSGPAIFDSTAFSKTAVFDYATFSGDAGFSSSIFSGHAMFNSATFSSDVVFDEAIFSSDVVFNGATFSGLNALFDKTTFSEYASFNDATFSEYARFDDATFSRGVVFGRATFSNAWFVSVVFNEYARFDGAKFEGDALTFRDAKFTDAQSQEEACRRAKNVLEKNGNRDEAGYHFYREMEGKRKQKESDYRYFDYEVLLFSKEIDIHPKKLTDLYRYLRYNILEYLIIQAIFGYGVHPRRIWVFWIFMAFIFAILYWIGNGINDPTGQPLTNFLEYLWFSITVAVTPGFGGNKPASWIYLVLAGVEAIFGTFMWAAFITTFARKFMR